MNKNFIRILKAKRLVLTALLMLIFLTGILSSCHKSEEEKIAVIWTDRVDFVSYCEVFNNLQSDYRVVVEYKENPAAEIIKAEKQPDIVISSWLKGSAARSKFKSSG